jgi:hypothetical protein
VTLVQKEDLAIDLDSPQQPVDHQPVSSNSHTESFLQAPVLIKEQEGEAHVPAPRLPSTVDDQGGKQKQKQQTVTSYRNAQTCVRPNLNQPISQSGPYPFSAEDSIIT